MPGIPISQKPRIARKSVMLDILGQRRLCHFLLFYVVLRPAVHRETPQRRQIQDGMETDFLKEQRSEEHTSELQSLMRISYAVFCLKKKKQNNKNETSIQK